MCKNRDHLNEKKFYKRFGRKFLSPIATSIETRDIMLMQTSHLSAMYEVSGIWTKCPKFSSRVDRDISVVKNAALSAWVLNFLYREFDKRESAAHSVEFSKKKLEISVNTCCGKTRECGKGGWQTLAGTVLCIHIRQFRLVFTAFPRFIPESVRRDAQFLKRKSTVMRRINNTFSLEQGLETFDFLDL